MKNIIIKKLPDNWFEINDIIRFKINDGTPAIDDWSYDLEFDADKIDEDQAVKTVNGFIKELLAQPLVPEP